MKALILLFSLLTFGSSSVWADNLLPYIEMPVSSNNLLTFSSQGVEFKECASCSITKLKPNSRVALYEQNTPVDIKQATELFVAKKYDSVSIFYNRQSNTYDKVVFGGHIEIEPIQPYPNFQQGGVL